MLTISKQQIIKELDLVPKKKLSEIENYIQFILSQSNNAARKTNEPKTLSGIWKGKGFEKIINLENEIRSTRKEIAGGIIKKYDDQRGTH